MAKKEKMVSRTCKTTEVWVRGFNTETDEITDNFFRFEGSVEDENEIIFYCMSNTYRPFKVLSTTVKEEKRAMPFSVWMRYSHPITAEDTENEI